MDLSAIFLGTGGSVPSARRSTASVMLVRGGKRMMFDCGEGTQRQLQRSLGLAQVDEIYLTHFHADHILGLPGLLKTYDLTDREVPLSIYGPPGLKWTRARQSATMAPRCRPSRSSTACAPTATP
jgi:ribonuclease Z